jgi:hypothetical protein
MKYVVVQRTGFVPYFLLHWDGHQTRWNPLRTIAKRFTRAQARRIADHLNVLSPAAPLPITIEASP